MLDPKKILDDFLGSNIPGVGTSVRDTAGKATQLAKDNPLAAGALAASSARYRHWPRGGWQCPETWRSRRHRRARLQGLSELPVGQGSRRSNGSFDWPSLLPPPDDSSFRPETAPQGEHEFALVLVRAMIAAARADGMVDETEKARIIEKLSLSGINSDTQAFLANELNSPVDVDGLVAAAVTDAQKVELYTASRLAIDPQTRAERGYLDLLAGRLKLPDNLIDHIEATVADVKVTSPA